MKINDRVKIANVPDKLYIDDMKNTLGKYGIIVCIGSIHDRYKIKMDDGNCWWFMTSSLCKVVQ